MAFGELLSEDFTDRRMYGTVMVRNLFAGPGPMAIECQIRSDAREIAQMRQISHLFDVKDAFASHKSAFASQNIS